MELAPGLGGILYHSLHLLVSILVFVELAPGRRPGRQFRRLHEVSILVFVELAPGP